MSAGWFPFDSGCSVWTRASWWCLRERLDFFFDLAVFRCPITGGREWLYWIRLGGQIFTGWKSNTSEVKIKNWALESGLNLVRNLINIVNHACLHVAYNITHYTILGTYNFVLEVARLIQRWSAHTNKNQTPHMLLRSCRSLLVTDKYIG